MLKLSRCIMTSCLGQLPYILHTYYLFIFSFLMEPCAGYKEHNVKLTYILIAAIRQSVARLRKDQNNGISRGEGVQYYVFGDYCFEPVRSFKYLGLAVSEDLDEKEEVRVTIVACFALKSKLIIQSMKLRLYKIFITSVVEYS